jgi:hypothetical protein
MASVREDLKNAYEKYVNSKNPKVEPVLQMLADNKEKFAVDTVNMMKKLNVLADKAEPTVLFQHINKILEYITKEKASARVRIHDSIKVSKQSDKQYRQHVLSKLEMVLSNITSILTKKARVLQAFMPKDALLKGGPTEPVRKELSQEKLLMFMRTPAAQQYGLDNMEVLGRLLQYNDLRQKITTLINAIDRGHMPRDGAEVMAEAADIKRLLDLKAATNESFFEAGEDEAQEATRQLTDPAEQWSQQMQQKKEERGIEQQEEAESEQAQQRIAPQVQQRDEEAKRRQIEEDRQRHIRSEGSSRLQQIMQRYK